MKILVTGGAGFIASHIVDRYIELGNEVWVIDNLSTGKKENLNPNARFEQINIGSKQAANLIVSEKFNVINHHAAQMNVRFSVDNPLADAENNILGTINLLESAKNSGVGKFIFASSGGTVYGDKSELPSIETSPTNPDSPYGITKLVGEKYLYYYKKFYGLNYVALRYGNVYGPRQNPKGEAGVVAIFAKKMIDGGQPIINGDGSITRDYIYISDVVDANVRSLENLPSGNYNITTGIETDVNRIFYEINEATGGNTKKIHGDPKKGEQKRCVCLPNKFIEVTGWQPEVNLQQGIAKTIEYFRSNN